MELSKLTKKAREIKLKYDELNIKRGKKSWGAREFAQGLVGDVGDLTKLLLAKDGFMREENIDEKIIHEIFDCFWSVLIIADELGINLEKEFFEQAEILNNKVGKLLNE